MTKTTTAFAATPEEAHKLACAGDRPKTRCCKFTSIVFIFLMGMLVGWPIFLLISGAHAFCLQ